VKFREEEEKYIYSKRIAFSLQSSKYKEERTA
jgi:hypothetical protein